MGWNRFEGRELAEYLEDYHDITRKDGETDWELRKRAFVEVFSADPVAAIEFLFGCRHDDLSPRDHMLMGIAMTYGGDEEKLTGFAEQFRADPMLSHSTTKKARQ